MAKKSLAEDLLEIVKSICFHLPAWAIPIVALASTLVVHILFHIIAAPLSSIGIQLLLSQLHFIALAFTFILTSIAGYVGWSQRGQRKELLKRTDTLSYLRALDWRQFEIVVAEYYRSKGYTVTETGGSKPDGGIDVDTISPNGQRVLIQCKHWKNSNVGVKVVREMLGVQAKERAAKIIIICTGRYTQEAIEYAKGQPIELVDGQALIHRISGLPSQSKPSPSQPTPNSPTTPNLVHPSKLATSTPIQENNPERSRQLPPCPNCGSQLVTRTAKRGPNAGNTFTGCSAFPKCRYTQST